MSNTNFFEIPLNPPTPVTSGVTYIANDITVGDVDGDGEYELFIEWEPDNAKDNSQDGPTDPVFIECIKLNGQSLWRINLGRNIRAGQHYTQMLVADYDLSGSAKLIVKTADGTVDGRGNVIGNANADHRNSQGRILAGLELLTLFCGKTGENLHTINYNPGRGTVSQWGDNWGNRVDRFLGAVAYLDGIRPSAVTIRGYYTRMAVVAYDVVDNRLVQRWIFDTGFNSSAPGFGNGNHNVMPANAHGDGRQSIFLGSTAIRHDGQLMWSFELERINNQVTDNPNNGGHGDALHVGKHIPSRSGLQVFTPHENRPFGMSLRDALTGELLFRRTGSGDTGRGVGANVWRGNDGSEFWSSGSTEVVNN